MARAKATITMRGAKPADEARWRIMWADFLTGDDEPCPAEATTRLWQDALADAGALRMLIAADESDLPIGFMVYVTHGYARSPPKAPASSSTASAATCRATAPT